MRARSTTDDAEIWIGHHLFEVLLGSTFGLPCFYSIVSKRHVSICVNNHFGLCQTLFASVWTCLLNFYVYTNAVKSRLPVHFPQQLRVGLEIDALDAHMPVFQLGIGIVIDLLFQLFCLF